MCEPVNLAYSAYTSENTLDCQDSNGDVHPLNSIFRWAPYTDMQGQSSFDYTQDGFETLAVSIWVSVNVMKILTDNTTNVYQLAEFDFEDCNSKTITWMD